MLLYVTLLCVAELFYLHLLLFCITLRYDILCCVTVLREICCYFVLRNFVCVTLC